MSKRLNLIYYLGAKSYLLNFILPKLKYDVNTYIEVFGGGGSILLNKKRHKIEIFNDINDEITDLFIVIRDYLDEFLQRLDLTIAGEKYLKYIKKQKPKDLIDKAIITYFKYKLSFNGTTGSFRLSYSNKENFYNTEFRAITNRLKDVYIINRDYKRVLEDITKGNRKNFMLYLDPPYIGKEDYYNKKTFTKEDHYYLAEYLNKNIDRHYFAISYNDCEEIRKLYKNWNIYSYEYIAYTYYNKKIPNGKRKKMIDVLITNYDIKQEGDNYVKDNQFNSSCNEFNNSNIECYTG